jgi:transposase
MTFVGIDISKNHLDVSVRPNGEAYRVTNDEAGIGQLVAKLTTPLPTLVVMEATGGYELSAASALAVAGVAVAVVNPRQVRDFAKATGKLAKTDAIDAGVLAQFAEVVRPEPRTLDDENTRALSAILARRRQLVDMIVAETNRMHSCRDSALRKRIYNHVAWLRRELKDVDRNMDDMLRKSPVWREQDDLLQAAGLRHPRAPHVRVRAALGIAGVVGLRDAPSRLSEMRRHRRDGAVGVGQDVCSAPVHEHLRVS